MGISMETEGSINYVIIMSRPVFLIVRRNVFDVVTWEKNSFYSVWCNQYFSVLFCSNFIEKY